MALSKPNTFQWTVNALANTSVSNCVVSNGGYAIGSASTTSYDPSLIINQGRMTVTVPLDVNGIDVEQVLKDLMQVTGVVARNRTLESKYKGLREEGERYRALLQKAHNDVNIIIKEAAHDYCIAEDKYKTFETIKDSK